MYKNNKIQVNIRRIIIKLFQRKLAVYRVFRKADLLQITILCIFIYKYTNI